MPVMWREIGKTETGKLESALFITPKEKEARNFRSTPKPRIASVSLHQHHFQYANTHTPTMLFRLRGERILGVATRRV